MISGRLGSMILFETLPGWPTAPEQSALEILLLTVIGPIVTAAVITLVVLGPKYFAKRHGSGTSTSGSDS